MCDDSVTADICSAYLLPLGCSQKRSSIKHESVHLRFLFLSFKSLFPSEIMAVYAPKRAQSAVVGRSDRPKIRPRLVFDEQHNFRTQHNRSQVEQSQQFPPCTACSIETNHRQGTRARPQSSYHCPRSIPPSHVEQRPSTAAKRAPPTSADLERLSRPKPVPDDRLQANNCNWSNFIKKKSKYGRA